MNVQKHKVVLHKKKMIWSRQDVPGPPGPRGPRSRDQTGQDLETLKVPWSRGPGTKQVQKSRDLKIGKVPGQWKPYIGPNDPVDSGKIRVPWLEPQPLFSCMIKVKVQLISRFLTKETFRTFTATNKSSPLVACTLKNSD